MATKKENPFVLNLKRTFYLFLIFLAISTFPILKISYIKSGWSEGILITENLSLYNTFSKWFFVVRDAYIGNIFDDLLFYIVFNIFLSYIILVILSIVQRKLIKSKHGIKN